MTPLPAHKMALQLDTNTKLLLIRLWREMLCSDWSRILLATLSMALMAASAGAYPLLIKYSFDLLRAEDPLILWLIPILIILTATLRGMATYFQQILNAAVVHRLLTRMRCAMYTHLVVADLALFVRETPGGLVSRFANDLNFIRDALTKLLAGFVLHPLTVLANLAVMLWLDWALAIVVLGIYPIVAIPIIRIGQRLRRQSLLVQEHTGDVTELLEESFSGIRLLKTYGLESYQISRAAQRFEELYKRTMRIVYTRGRLDPLLEIVGGIAIAGVIAFAGWRVLKGAGTIGDLTGFITALLIAAPSVRALGTMNASLQEGLAAVDRVFALLDEKPKIIDSSTAYPLKIKGGEIRLTNVTFRYGGSNNPTAALRELTFTIPAGATVAIVGPSGAGKSTLLDLIARLLICQSGVIEIDGQDINQVTLSSLRAAITLVSQDVVLFNDTVQANIAYGRLEADKAAIIEAACMAAANEFIQALPESYDTLVGERGGRFSGGERQRLALARAVLRDAPILLLDEATSALDAENEAKVQAALDKLAHNRTCLVIAHRLATVRMADLILVLDKGRVVEQGNHDQLCAANGLYARLCHMQFFTDSQS